MTDVNYPDNPPADAAVPADDASIVEVPADTTPTKEEATAGTPDVAADVTGADLDTQLEPDQPVDIPETELQPGEVLITRDNPRPGPGVATAMYDDELPEAGPGQGHVLPNGIIAGSENIVEGGFQAPDRLIPRPEDVPHPDEVPETASETPETPAGTIPGESAPPEAPTAEPAV